MAAESGRLIRWMALVFLAQHCRDCRRRVTIHEWR
eukprot:COSAG02_NODE_52549_length_307_cov_0.735577_1_plen_34_part_01